MSTIQAANISDGTDAVGTEYVINGSAKAWVNFNGTGTVSIRDSLNYSSISDLGVGDYSLSFSSNFSNSVYSSPYGCSSFGILTDGRFLSYTSSGYSTDFRRSNNGDSQDVTDCFMSNFGDLA